jgi:hypothetical protein
MSGSLRLHARELDHLAPFLGFVGDELPKVGGGPWKHCAAQIGKPRLHLPESFRNGAFVGEHGSWNRKPASGYKVVFISFANGRPSGPPVDVLNGFLATNGDARGRPVGVAMATDGALLVATMWEIRFGASRPLARRSARAVATEKGIGR